MMTLRLTGKIPFETVYIHGLVRDGEGQKMSKTKGNGLDPLDFIDGIDVESLVQKRTANLTQPKMAKRIEKLTRKDFPEGVAAYGTDALRFTFCALATTGRDVRFDVSRVDGYRNFCNKLWNASKFVLMNTADEDLSQAISPSPNVIDRWILSKASKLIEDCRLALDTYRFDLCANAIYEFVWHEYCDWYLELSKSILWNDDLSDQHKAATRRTLLEVLELLLRISHPIMPFITETLWLQIAPKLGISGASVMVQAYPESSQLPTDDDAQQQIEWLKSLITALRNIRGEASIKPSLGIPLLLQDGDQQDRVQAAQAAEMLKRLANVTSIDWLEPGQEPPPNALALVGDLRVMVPLAGLIDVDAERARLTKELSRCEADLGRITGKLSNDNFVSKAPAEVVAKERQRAQELQTTLATLAEQMQQLADLK